MKIYSTRNDSTSSVSIVERSEEQFIVLRGLEQGENIKIELIDIDGEGIYESKKIRFSVDGSPSFQNMLVNGDVSIKGNLIVEGETTNVDTTDMSIEDNLILINKGELGSGVTKGSAGVEVDRGILPSVKFTWEESAQYFTTNGELFGNIAVPTAGNHVGDRNFNDNRYLLKSNNLSDIPNSSIARTSLGLGSISTQSSNNVSISGGSINNTMIGNVNAASGKFTNIDVDTLNGLSYPSTNGSENQILLSTGDGSLIWGQISGENLGSGNSIFYQLSGTNLQFKSLIAGNDVLLTSSTDTITIGSKLTYSNLGIGAKVLSGKNVSNVEFKSILSGNTDISISETSSEITITSNIDVSSVGSGEQIISQKNGSVYEFKSLIAGNGLQITSNTSSITFDIDEYTISNIGTGEGLYSSESSNDFKFKSLVAGNGITITPSSTDITISTVTYTASSVGTGTSIYASKTGSNFEFKTLKSNTGITISETPTEITFTPDIYTATSIGSGTAIYAGTNDTEFSFRSLLAGDGITISEADGNITIRQNPIDPYTASNIGTGTYGIFKTISDNNIEFKTISAGDNISISEENDVISISGNFELINDSGPMLGGNLDVGGHEINDASGAILFGKNIRHYMTDINSGNSYTINVQESSEFIISLTENIEVIFSGEPTTGSITFDVWVKQEETTGNMTVTWPLTVKWPGGVAPTMTAWASAVDLYRFTSWDGGTTWYGRIMGANFS